MVPIGAPYFLKVALEKQYNIQIHDDFAKQEGESVQIEKQVKELLEHDLIEEGTGAWSSPAVLVKKKSGDWRFCIDFR